MFNTEEMNELTGGKYITPGVHEITIVSITCPNPSEEYVEVSVKLKDADDDAILSKRFYMNEKAKSLNGAKIVAMLKATNPEQNCKIVAANIEEFVNIANARLQGKSYRQLFICKEYQGKDGSIKKGPEFPLATTVDNGDGTKRSEIVESITANTMYPMISQEESKLVYDPINISSHYKKLATTATPTEEVDKEASW